MEMNEDQFFHGLLQNFPQLESLHAEHVEFYEEFLSHVFLADVVRWAVGLFSEAGQSSTEEAIGIRLINFIEGAYVHGDCAVRELVRVSFVENLPYSGQEGFRIREHLTGNLRKMFTER
ncbi:hypothetical protein GCM10010358_76960 [Streptomyces minutiscleroticus]|uniref:DUF7674 domain-containing protein n=2 Tax=Streptomyces minutiscleroticus TaxID=68238 RepID=A0A918U8Y1_9ACTN|nr:hypothetical protein GCM10010358_76960 [Streptomyces minutiscleroticus]